VDITAIKTTLFPTIVIVMIKNKIHPIAILSAGITVLGTPLEPALNP
jgi:hypothetical protein